MLHRLPFIALLIALTACGAQEPYPYTPQFVSVADVGTHAIPAPPAQGSAAYADEMEGIIARQAALTPAQRAIPAAENHISPEMIIVPVLGPRYTAETYPALYALLNHAASDAWRISDATEDYYLSPRPWYADKRVELLVPAIRRPGYPSGHTTTNTVWAHILSELFPHQRKALFARALEIGGHRIDGGAHFPHDIVGGKQMGDIIYSKMKRNAQYMRELTIARNEIRQGLTNHRMQ